MSDAHYVATLEERIVDLMVDGQEWTVKGLAEALEARRWRVRLALRTLAASRDVRVVRTVGRAHVRVFRSTPFDDSPPRGRPRGRARPKLRRWPSLDPLIAHAIRAMALVR